jgi:hypothetical protein
VNFVVLGHSHDDLQAVLPDAAPADPEAD